jgi:putative transposase
MRTYRRVRVAGAIYFLTFNLAQRRNASLLVDRVDALREAFKYVRVRWPFTTHAIVILPDHLHWLVELPEGDSNFSTRVRLIKSAFSRAIDSEESIHASRMKKGERGIWQRRFWEHVIRDELDFQRHMDYIHFNPVKHGHVKRARDWPHGSFLRCVAAGMYDLNWGNADDSFSIVYDD